MKKFDINKFQPCEDGLEYYNSHPDFETAWNNCERGDWMLWIAKKLEIDDRALTLAKAYCANTIRHLMKDQRSLDAVDATIKYGSGEISREELDKFADAAFAASYAASSAAYATAYAAAAAASRAASADANAAATSAARAASADASAAAAAAARADASADAYTAAAAAARADAYAAAYAAARKENQLSRAARAASAAARKENQLLTADICRKYLTEEVFNKIK